MVALLSALWLAHAGDTVSVSADLGGTARYIDHIALSDPSGFGMVLGARAEVYHYMLARLDMHYVEGKLFNPDEDRLFDLSAALSSPTFFIFCVDVQEIGYRESSRPGDDLFYLHAGIGARTRLGVTLKGSLGVTYLSASGVIPSTQRYAVGGYAGADLLIRTRFFDSSLRVTPFFAIHETRTYGGMTMDGDMTIKIPVDGVYVGPRIDMSYRNLGLGNPREKLFGQRQELTAHFGLAVYWGTGG